jgi:ribonucleoside-diphosphate reductase alpha chain
MESWRQGLKAVAIYRDGSKGVQPLNVSMDAKSGKHELSGLDLAGERVLADISAGKAPNEADLRAVEGGIGDRVEVSAKTIAAAAKVYEAALGEIAKAAAVPTLARNFDELSAAAVKSENLNAPPPAVRHRLPEERASITHKFGIGGHEGYITVGLYPTGQPGEIFIRMAKEGSTVSGLMDAFATSISIALQHGVPLKILCEKFAHTRFEPSGWTGNEQIGYAKSLMDYIFRWLQLRFLSGTQLPLFAGMLPTVPQLGAAPPSLIAPENETEEQSHLAKLAEEVARRLSQVNAVTETEIESRSHEPAPTSQAKGTEMPPLADRGVYHHPSDAMRDMYAGMGDAPSCHTCGAIMVRNGSCYRCMSCGSTSGCS